MNPKTTSSPPARRTRCANFASTLSRVWDETGRTTSSFTPTSSGLPKSSCWIGAPEKAKQKLGWAPSVGLEELVAMMVDADVARVREER
jgi:GDP-D-mannose dehydratase